MATENSRLSAGQILFAIIYILMCPILVLLLSGDWIGTGVMIALAKKH